MPSSRWICFALCSGWLIVLEQFSLECRTVIGFELLRFKVGLKELALLCHPIRIKTKTNRDALAHVFPRFATAACNYFEF